MQSSTARDPQQTKTNKTNKNVYEVDLIDLKPENKILLGTFLAKIQKNLIILDEVEIPSLTQEEIEKLTFEQRSYTHLKFDNALKYRACESGFNQWHFDVYERNPIASGTYGSVTKIVCTITGDNEGNITVQKKANVGVGKTQEVDKQKNIDFRRLQEIILNEYQLSNRLPELHMKPPTFFGQSANLVMKFIKGITVEQFAKNEAFARDNKKPRVSSVKRLHASMMAARKLYIQHLRNIINRDIKPANVMVDFEYPVKLTLMDLGLGRDASIPTPKMRKFGTPLYAPSEFYEKTPSSFKTDIYGLAWIFIFLWGGEDNASDTWEKADKFAHNSVAKGLFFELTDITKEHQIIISDLIHNMLSSKSTFRPGLPEILEILEKIALDYSLKSYPSKKKELIIANDAGIKLRKDLDSLFKAKNRVSVDRLHDLSALLEETFSPLALSSPMELDIFVNRTYVECWRKSASLGHIKKITYEAIENYKQSFKTFCDLQGATENLNITIYKGEQKSSEKIISKLNYLSQQIEKGLAHANVYFSIDEIVLAQAKMQKYSLQCKALYADLIECIRLESGQKDPSSDCDSLLWSTEEDKSDLEDHMIVDQDPAIKNETQNQLSLYSSGLFNSTDAKFNQNETMGDMVKSVANRAFQ